MQDSNKLLKTMLDGRYMVNGVIGKGGSACVYRATDVLLDRTVALKILEDDKNEYRINSRSFETEIHAVARLSHPNIVNVYDVTTEGSVKYIVMEYVEGITLGTYLKHKKMLSVSEALSCARQVLRALREAHEKGIVHRDIKPQNIMIMKNGQIKVADFGIARLPDKDSFALDDRSIGTVHYISPEQAKGNTVDARSDLYSLAIVMYEMLTGTRPFDAPKPTDVVMMQVTDTPTRPIAINPTIPKELDAVIMRALSKRPENRYESATEMLRALERASTSSTADRIKESGRGFFASLKEKKAQAREQKQALYENEEDSEELNSAILESLSTGTAEELSSYEELDENDYGRAFVVMPEEEYKEEEEAEPDAEEQLEAPEQLYDAEDEISPTPDAPTQVVKTVGSPVVLYGEGGLVHKGEERYPVRYVSRRKRARSVVAVAISLLVTVSVVFAGILIYNANKRYEVPFYTGMPIDSLTEQSTFTLQIKRENSLAHPVGTVISQSVPAGEMRKRGTEILLTVSDGPKAPLRFSIPEGAYDIDFAYGQLESQIREKGYSITLSVKYEYSQTLERGLCFAIDEQLQDGGILIIRVSAGAEKTYVEVPDFKGMALSQAIEFLSDNSISYDIVYSESAGDVGTVTDQSVDAGKMTEAYVEEGKITLTVGGRKS